MRWSRRSSACAERCLAIMALVVLTAAACGGDDGEVSTGDEPSSLAGRTFLSESVTGHTLVPGTQIRLTFHEDGRLTASAGCNTMGGPVEVDEDRLVISDLSTTEIGCDPARHEQDEWLAGTLAADPRYSATADRLRLETGGTVVELVDREVADPDRPLEGTRWRLDGIIDGEAVSSVPEPAGATLVFAGGQLTVEVTGCNQGEADAEIGGGEIRVGPLTMTDMACEQPAADVEAAVVAVLEGTITYQIEAAALTLQHPDGKGLTLRAEEQ